MLRLVMNSLEEPSLIVEAAVDTVVGVDNTSAARISFVKYIQTLKFFHWVFHLVNISQTSQIWFRTVLILIDL